jgi:hypothetical protein
MNLLCITESKVPFLESNPWRQILELSKLARETGK